MPKFAPYKRPRPYGSGRGTYIATNRTRMMTYLRNRRVRRSVTLYNVKKLPKELQLEILYYLIKKT